MSRRCVLWLVLLLIMTIVPKAFAGEHGTPVEARAMLERVVLALKHDPVDALRKFNRGTDGFRDRDLYPFCAGPDGMLTAHPINLGTALAGSTDKNGKPFGDEIMASAREGVISEVSYMFPRPGETEPVAKSSYVTKVGDQICGVGYYLP